MEIKFTKPPFFLKKEILQFIMRTFIFLFCTTVFSFSPGTIFSQNTKITIGANKIVTIDEIFELISKQSEYVFVYQADLFKNTPKVRLKKGIVKANKLLKESLFGNDFSFEVIENNTIIIRQKTVDEVPQDPIRVTGKVTDEDGTPLPGVTVRISGTNTGVATNFDGNYTLIVPRSESVLVFTSIGFATKEIIVGDQTVINVTMQEAVNELDEVILNAGYYNVSERTKTGSIGKIDTKIIAKQPVNNPLAAMQGHIAGVDITQVSSLSGSSIDIEIRGQNFIGGGTNPLFIVDGVPFGSESLGTFRGQPEIIPGGNISPLNALSPTDIESIEVLKDADATAIYGARGANGVVLITTKKGKVGKTRIDINVSSTLSQVSRFADLMNTEQYLEMRREALVNDGFDPLPPAFEPFFPHLFQWDQNRFTDWQKELIGGTAYRNNAQLSISGGNERTQFLLSGTLLNETTVFPGDSNYGKASVRTNINHQSKDNRLKLNISTSYVSEDNRLPSRDFSSSALRLAPNAPALFDTEGNLNWENTTWINPLAQLESDYRAQTYNLIANTVLSYQLLPALELKANMGYNEYQLESYTTDPHTRFDPAFDLDSRSSQITTNDGKRRSWIVEPQLNWEKKWGNARIKLLVGATFQQENSGIFIQRGSNFPSNSLLFDLSAAETVETFTDEDTEYNYQAFFGRLNFNWKDRYILNLTGRRDGSSRFGPGRQFGNFGAIGAAWLFSKEEFLKNSSFLSFGKLRGSYGTTGSDNIGNYQFFDTYTTTSDLFNYNGTGLEPTRLFNPDFGWEENKKLEATLELGFWKDRLFFTTAYYRNRSSNQLIGIPLATTTGFNSLNSNFDATVENTGVEVDFRSVNIQKENFSWSTTFNITVPKNKLVQFPGLEGSTFANTLVVGESLNTRKLYHALGVDSETGLYQFEDFNDDGEISAADDREWLENFDPSYFGGLGNTFKYGNLELDFFFQFKKQKRFNHFRDGLSPGGAVNRPIEFLDRWQEPGDEASIQRYSVFDPAALTAVGRQADSNAAVSDASFVRLRNVSLTYTVPKGVIHGMDASIYLQGQNLFVISGFERGDPEQPTTDFLAPLRQFTLGLNVSF